MGGQAHQPSVSLKNVGCVRPEAVGVNTTLSNALVRSHQRCLVDVSL
jgi:hypothetical protein